ncbi:MAG: stage II sporulation protein M [Deltaproteobacteria bacterium]|nr:stage II sporulation protein M [Deltaproteobacteria bacterium]
MQDPLFKKKYGPTWVALSRLADRVDRNGAASLNPADTEELSRLYRASTAHLARARTYKLSTDTLRLLNGLIARVHAQIYAGGAGQARRAARFLLEGLPRLVRKSMRFILFAIVIDIVPGIITYFWVKSDMENAKKIVPASWVQNAEHFAKGFDRDPSGKSALMTAFYVSNNSGVAFKAFATGITFGVGTAVVMISNGFILGASVAIVDDVGATANFVAFVSSHGAIEIFGIYMAAGAGFMLGLALIRPGRLTRKEALALAAKDGIGLVVGAAMMMGVAALLEGFVSPSTLPNAAKYGIGLTNFLLVVIYFGFAGREKSRDARQD